MHNVSGNRMDLRGRKNVADCIGSNVGLTPSYVRIAIKNAAGEIGGLDRVKIDYNNVGKAEQREVFQDLISQRPCADDQHTRRAKLFLVPPADQTKPAEAVIFFHRRPGGRQRLAHRAPAVISGCRRRMSPSFTAASARVCASWIWRPEFL